MNAENPLYYGVRPRYTIPVKSCFFTKVNGCSTLCLKGIHYIWVVCLKGIFQAGLPISLVGWSAIRPVPESWAIWWPLSRWHIINVISQAFHLKWIYFFQWIYIFLLINFFDVVSTNSDCYFLIFVFIFWESFNSNGYSRILY